MFKLSAGIVSKKKTIKLTQYGAVNFVINGFH
jgi:hypothetical protein